jgi:endonuclease/exonuclease/phosphatase family metal-dependent hydrolase
MYISASDVPYHIYTFRQRSWNGFCFPAALNDGLQQSIFDLPTLHASVSRSMCTRPVSDGWFTADEIATAISRLSDGFLTLRAGHPHLGRSAGTSWRTTLSRQPFNAYSAPFLLLSYEEAGLPPVKRRHVVCALRRHGPGAASVWFILDSALPDLLAPLEDHAVALAFDASVWYLDFDDSMSSSSCVTLPSRRQLICLLRPVHARIPTREPQPRDVPPWPDGPQASSDESWSMVPLPPVTLRLFVPLALLRDRLTFLHICREERLFLLSHAKYTCDRDHLRLTVMRQDHLRAMRNADMREVATMVLQRTTWRLVGWNSPPPATCVSGAAPPLVLSNRFRALRAADHEDTHHGRFSCDTRHRSGHGPRNSVTLGTFNVAGKVRRPHGMIQTQHLMTVRDVDVLALQETHESRAERVTPLSPDFRYYGELSASSQAKGGGVGFLVRGTVGSAFQYLGRRKAKEPFAAAWARIKGTSKHSTLHVASVYLPHAGMPAADRAHALKLLEEDVLYYRTQPGVVLLLGDFNARVGSTPYAEPTDPAFIGPAYGDAVRNCPGTQLHEMCVRNNLYFLSGRTASVWTHTCRNRSCVDHIIGDKSALSWSLSARLLPMSAPDVRVIGSDHAPLLVTAPLCRPNPITPPRIVIKRWRLNRLRDPAVEVAYRAALTRQCASLAHLFTELHHSDGDAAALLSRLTDAVVSAFVQAAQSTIGEKTIVLGRTKPWVTTPAVAKAVACRQFMHARWKARSTPAHEAALLAADEHAKRLVNMCKMRYNKRHAQLCRDLWKDAPGSRDAWVALKRLGPASTSLHISALRTATGEIVTDDASMAETLGRHYSAINTPKPFTSPFPDVPEVQAKFDNHHAEIAAAVADMRAFPSLDHAEQDAPFTNDEVDKALSKLKRFKAAGPDRVPAELLKSGGAAALQVLTDLFNAVWQRECMPSQWRKGVIVSLYKDGDRTACSNYRPITILPVMDKLFAAVLAKRLQQHVPLHSHQFAYRPGRSTTDVAFVMSSLIQSRRDAGKRTYAFLLDVLKAFDTVWHDAMFYKLHHKGVRGKLWRVTTAMYDDAYSIPRVGSSYGPPVRLHQGVAQGCPMSPTLFNIHMDDMLDAVQTECPRAGLAVSPSNSVAALSFADDSVGLSGSATGLQQVINSMLGHSLRNKWAANVGKSHVIVFNPDGEPDDPPPGATDSTSNALFVWGAQTISRATSTKHLGYMYTQDCTWTAHAKHAAQKGLCAYHLWVNTLRNRHLPASLKLRVIRTFIKPCMHYGAEIWTAPPCTTTVLDKPVHLAISAVVQDSPVHALAMCPRHLLRHDTGIHMVKHDSMVAHVRYHARISAEPDSLPAQVLATLPPQHDWVARVQRYKTDLGAAHPPLTAALRTDANTRYNRSQLNCVLARAVSAFVHAHFVAAAPVDSHPIYLTAIRAPAFKSLPMYLDVPGSRHLLLFRSGVFDRDVASILASRRETQVRLRSRAQHCASTSSAPVRKRKRICMHHADRIEPPHLRCTDCNVYVQDEFDGRSDAAHARNLVLHRLLYCPKHTKLTAWFFDVAVRVVPKPRIAVALALLKTSHTVVMTGVMSQAQDWFLEFLTSPWSSCAKGNLSQRRTITQAVVHYLSTLDESWERLPDVSSFGPAPSIVFRDLDICVSYSELGYSRFWTRLLDVVHSVPLAVTVQEPEADALVVPGARRRLRR